MEALIFFPLAPLILEVVFMLLNLKHLTQSTYLYIVLNASQQKVRIYTIASPGRSIFNQTEIKMHYWVLIFEGVSHSPLMLNGSKRNRNIRCPKSIGVNILFFK